MELIFNGMGILKIENGRYYIVDDTWEVYKQVDREEFIKELNKFAYVCLASWDKQDRNNYLKLVDYLKENE